MPWGIQQLRERLPERCPLTKHFWLRLFKYDLNQLPVVPSNPYAFNRITGSHDWQYRKPSLGLKIPPHSRCLDQYCMPSCWWLRVEQWPLNAGNGIRTGNLKASYCQLVSGTGLVQFANTEKLTLESLRFNSTLFSNLLLLKFTTLFSFPEQCQSTTIFPSPLLRCCVFACVTIFWYKTH